MELEFWLRTERTNKKGASIMARLLVNDTVKSFSTGLKCRPTLWDNVRERSKGTDDSSKTINKYLDLLQARHNTIFIRGEYESTKLCYDKVKDYILNETPLEKPAPMLVEYFQMYIEKFKKNPEWKIRFKQLTRALKALNIEEIRLSDVLLKHAYQIYDYFILTEKREPRSAARSVRNCNRTFAFMEKSYNLASCY